MSERCDLTVTCGECGSTGRKQLPSVSLLGETVVFTDPTDDPSMYYIHKTGNSCVNCVAQHDATAGYGAD